jgi:hypothetical protein
MNAIQQAKLKMYRATEKHCDDNASIIASLPAFQTALARFKAKIANILSTTQQKDVVLTGITTDKSNSKQMLCQIASDIANLVFAYADTNNNNTLKQEVNYNYTKLIKTREDQLAPRCQNIHDKALANIQNLEDFGIESHKLTNLQDAINNYQENSPKTRTATSNRKTLNANLSQLFKETDSILKNQMDKLVVAFRNNNPNFVATYETNRIIIDPSKTTTQLRGKITSKADGKPIKNASIQIVEANITVQTNAKGDYLVKPLPVGEYTVRITATGFETKEIDEVDAKLGVINTLNVAM